MGLISSLISFLLSLKTMNTPNIPDKRIILADSRATNLGFYSHVLGWIVLTISLFAPVSESTRNSITQAVIASSIGSGIIARSNKIVR